MRGAHTYKVLKALDLLSNRNGVTVEQIADEEGIEISKRSAYRLLAIIEELGFPLQDIRDKINNRVRKRLDPDFFQRTGPVNLPEIKFTSSELMALYFLKGEAINFKGSSLECNIESAFSKIGFLVPKGISKKLSKLQGIFLSDDKLVKDYAGMEDIIDQLVNAMMSDQTCQVLYHSFYDDKMKNFSIDPLHLFEHQGGLYLFVNISTSGEIRILAVNRIKKIEVSGTYFSYPENFDPNERLKNTFGIINDEQIELEIWFSKKQSKYIREKTWSPTQKIIEQEDGSIILKMTTSGRYEIKRWIMSWGVDANLLKPVDLRKEISSDLKLLAKKYESY